MQREDEADRGNEPGTNSSESAVNHLSKSVVRENRTPRSVGTGGERLLPVTRSQGCNSPALFDFERPSVSVRRLPSWVKLSFSADLVICQGRSTHSDKRPTMAKNETTSPKVKSTTSKTIADKRAFNDAKTTSASAIRSLMARLAREAASRD